MRRKGGRRGRGNATMEDVGGRRTISSVLKGALSSLVVHSNGFWQDSDGDQPEQLPSSEAHLVLFGEEKKSKNKNFDDHITTI